MNGDWKLGEANSEAGTDVDGYDCFMQIRETIMRVNFASPNVYVLLQVKWKEAASNVLGSDILPS